jgi:SAM-dependent methyltransferase
MGSAERDVRARSFGSVASHYERARPGYPEEAIQWLLDQQSSKVIDLGAGTGKLTRHLARLAHRVVAVEPSIPMIERVNEGPAAAWAVCAVAEAIPVETGWADVVTAAQAFHWFNLERALTEIHRVLRPGGRVGLIWNRRDESVGWVRELSDIIGSSGDAEVTGVAGAERFRNDSSHGELTASPLFGPIEHKAFEHHQKLRSDDLVSRVESSSTVAVLADHERIDLLRSVEKLCREHPDLRGRQSFTLPYRTHAFRTSTPV